MRSQGAPSVSGKRARWLRKNHSGIVVDRFGSRQVTKSDLRKARKGWKDMTKQEKREMRDRIDIKGHKFVQKVGSFPQPLVTPDPPKQPS